MPTALETDKEIDDEDDVEFEGLKGKTIIGTHENMSRTGQF